MPLSQVYGAQSLIKAGVCTSSSRPASPFEGQLIYETDTDRLLTYNGSAWIIQSGLQYITSTTGTAASSLIIDNCFTSTYENYRILIVGKTSADVYLKVQFRVGGVAAATNYTYQIMSANSTSVAASQASAQTSGNFTPMETSDTNAATIDIYKPNVAIATGWQSFSIYNSATQSINFVCGRHTTATAYDGLVITPASGTVTATMYVYGYSK